MSVSNPLVDATATPYCPTYREPAGAAAIERALVELKKDAGVPPEVAATCSSAAAVVSSMRSFNNLLSKTGPTQHRKGLVGCISVANGALKNLEGGVVLPEAIVEAVTSLVEAGQEAMKAIHPKSSSPEVRPYYSGLIPLDIVLTSAERLVAAAKQQSGSLPPA